MKTLRDCPVGALLFLVALLVAAPASAQWLPGGRGTETGLAMSDGAGNFIGFNLGTATKRDTSGIPVWTATLPIGQQASVETAVSDQAGGAFIGGRSNVTCCLTDDISA